METYEDAKKEYGLPDFEKLDFEFEIATLEEDGFILRNVRKKIAERLDYFAKLLEEQLQPEATLPIIHECRFLDDNDKTTLFDTYKKLMNLIRKASRLAIDNAEKEDADYINLSLAEWEQMKKPIKELLQKFEDCWSKDLPVEEELRYFG